MFGNQPGAGDDADGVDPGSPRSADAGLRFDDLPAAETTRTLSPVGREPDPSADLDDTAEDAEARSISGLPPDTALLVVKRGPNAGSRFLLDQSVTTAGRHPRSDIFLDDVTVSRRHAEFRRDGDRFTVHDVGSLNGTYVNGERAEKRQLATGDEVQVGKFKLVAHVADPA